MNGKHNIICCLEETEEITKRIGTAHKPIVVRLDDVDLTENDAILQHDILEIVQPRVNFFAKCCTVIVTCSFETLEKQGVDNLRMLYRKTIQAIVNDFVDNNCDIPDFTTFDWSNAHWIEKHNQTLIPVEYDENGEPILHDYTIYVCSICGRWEKNKEPYCNCGAKMNK